MPNERVNGKRQGVETTSMQARQHKTDKTETQTNSGVWCVRAIVVDQRRNSKCHRPRPLPCGTGGKARRGPEKEFRGVYAGRVVAVRSFQGGADAGALAVD